MEKKIKKVIILEVGVLIRHTTQDFGNGRVMAIANGVVTIKFEKVGKKNFPASSRFLQPIEPAEQDELPVEST